jgi:hypothetical protein
VAGGRAAGRADLFRNLWIFPLMETPSLFTSLSISTLNLAFQPAEIFRAFASPTVVQARVVFAVEKGHLAEWHSFAVSRKFALTLTVKLFQSECGQAGPPGASSGNSNRSFSKTMPVDPCIDFYFLINTGLVKEIQNLQNCNL